MMNRNWEDISNDCNFRKLSLERGISFCTELGDHWNHNTICSMNNCVRQVIIVLGQQELWKCPVCKRMNNSITCPVNHLMEK